MKKGKQIVSGGKKTSRHSEHPEVKSGHAKETATETAAARKVEVAHRQEVCPREEAPQRVKSEAEREAP